MKRVVVLFPGQGSQFVGMGESLAAFSGAARDIFRRADKVLGMSLSSVMARGPAEELQATHHAQPALLAVSIAVLEALRERGSDLIEGGRTAFVMGHSVGEYTALCAAGAVSLEDCVALLRRRGEAMGEEGKKVLGGMVALLGGDEGGGEALARRIQEERGGCCVVANDNCTGQVVLSGEKSNMQAVVDLVQQGGAKEWGISRAVALSVSGAFHSPLMSPVVGVLEKAFERVSWGFPCVPVVSNVSAQPIRSIEVIKPLLAQQVASKVRFRESLETVLRQKVDAFVEVGAGKVLGGLVKRMGFGGVIYRLETPEDIVQFSDLYG